jgi:hypothetical protein
MVPRARASPPRRFLLFALPVWLADQFVRALREQAAEGDARAAEQLEAMAAPLVTEGR